MAHVLPPIGRLNRRERRRVARLAKHELGDFGRRREAARRTPEVLAADSALRDGFAIWRARRPWRWLPERVAQTAFPILGRRFADAYIGEAP